MIGATQADFEDDLTRLLDKFKINVRLNVMNVAAMKELFNEIFNPCNPTNTVSLTAGWLAVKDAKVLGRIGNVLVLSKYN